MTEKENKKIDISKLPIYKVILGQYGNNIKKLVDYAKNISDRQVRNEAARQIIEAMRIMNQDIQKVEDYERILWNHLAILSNYELDVDYPYPIISVEEYNKPPELIDYPDQNIRIRHYGKIIEKLIDRAIEIKDAQTRNKFVELILIQMKKAYLFHAYAGTYVKDEIIYRDFNILARGKLQIPEGFNLPHSKEILEKYKNIPELEAERRQRQKFNQNNRKK